MTVSATRRYRDRIAAASLCAGPLLMAAGDLYHPAEDMDAAIQAEIIAGAASRWYLSHLLLFIGLLVLLPGLLAVTALAKGLWPSAGYVSRILVLTGGVAVSGIFVFEMLVGRYVADGADLSAAQALLETFFSAAVAGFVMPAALCFFAGVLLISAVFLRSGRMRWPAIVFGLGAILIVGEIVTAQVLFSQIGNLLLLAAGIGFAQHILVESAPS